MSDIVNSHVISYTWELNEIDNENCHCLHNSHCTLRSWTNLFCDIWVHSVVCLPLFLSCINIKTSTSSKIITIIFTFNATWSYKKQEFHVTCLPTLLIGKKTQLPKLVSSFHSHGKCSVELISPHSNEPSSLSADPYLVKKLSRGITHKLVC